MQKNVSTSMLVKSLVSIKPGFHKANYDHDNNQFRVKTKRLA